MKESGLRIRVASQLRHEFIEACKKKDTTAAQVIRAFMRQYVGNQTTPLQINLFSQESWIPKTNDE